jgi:hypothetical protein
MTKEEKDLQKLLERHKAFWTREKVDSPLLEYQGVMEWVEKPYPVKGGGVAVDPRKIMPEEVDVERLVGLPTDPEKVHHEDYMKSVGCLYPAAWMGSLIGSDIYVSAFGCVTKPTGVNLTQALDDFSADRAMESSWMEVLDKALEHSDAVASEKFSVRQPHLRGVVDMLAACLGETAYCMAPFDQPAELAKLADKYADFYISVAKRTLSKRREWHGGYTTRWGLYSPGPVIDYQVDASTIVSPDMYEEVFLEYDRRVISSFDYSIVHLHSVGLHIIDPLLKIDELDAIEVNLDREIGEFPKQEILQWCRKIQDASKSVLVIGELNDEELNEFLSELRPEGLAIWYWT